MEKILRAEMLLENCEKVVDMLPGFEEFLMTGVPDKKFVTSLWYQLPDADQLASAQAVSPLCGFFLCWSSSQRIRSRITISPNSSILS